MAAHGLRHWDRTADLIRRMWSANRTILMVEHNLRVVANLSHRITVLTRGRVLAEGDYREVSENEEVKQALSRSGAWLWRRLSLKRWPWRTKLGLSVKGLQAWYNESHILHGCRSGRPGRRGRDFRFDETEKVKTTTLKAIMASSAASRFRRVRRQGAHRSLHLTHRPARRRVLS